MGERGRRGGEREGGGAIERAREHSRVSDRMKGVRREDSAETEEDRKSERDRGRETEGKRERGSWRCRKREEEHLYGVVVIDEDLAREERVPPAPPTPTPPPPHSTSTPPAELSSSLM